MGLKDNVNKCALPINNTSAVRHTVSALLQSGVDNIVIVIGYESGSVKNAIEDIYQSGKVLYVENPHYNYHGCNYSLACTAESNVVTDANRLIIAEGDSLLNYSSIDKVVNSEIYAASLIRSVYYIDYSRSVIAVGNDGKIMRYEYDIAHTGLPPILNNNEQIIGESMQLWSFSGSTLTKLKKLLRDYKYSADESNDAFMHSGVYSINQLSMDIEPINSDYPDDWINLNTIDDLKRAGKVNWLLR